MVAPRREVDLAHPRRVEVAELDLRARVREPRGSRNPRRRPPSWRAARTEPDGDRGPRPGGAGRGQAESPAEHRGGPDLVGVEPEDQVLPAPRNALHDLADDGRRLVRRRPQDQRIRRCAPTSRAGRGAPRRRRRRGSRGRATRARAGLYRPYPCARLSRPQRGNSRRAHPTDAPGGTDRPHCARTATWNQTTARARLGRRSRFRAESRPGAGTLDGRAAADDHPGARGAGRAGRGTRGSGDGRSGGRGGRGQRGGRGRRGARGRGDRGGRRRRGSRQHPGASRGGAGPARRRSPGGSRGGAGGSRRRSAEPGEPRRRRRRPRTTLPRQPRRPRSRPSSSSRPTC